MGGALGAAVALALRDINHLPLRVFPTIEILAERRSKQGGVATVPRVYAPGRIRTCDLSLRRRALYPLSYGRWEQRSLARKKTGRLARARRRIARTVRYARQRKQGVAHALRHRRERSEQESLA